MGIVICGHAEHFHVFFGSILLRRQFFLESMKVPRREAGTSPEVRGGGASLRDPRVVSGSMLYALIWQR